MSKGLGISAMAAKTLLASATSAVHGGDYSAIAPADHSVPSVQQSVQPYQLSHTARAPDARGATWPRELAIGASRASVGNLHRHCLERNTDGGARRQEVSAILGKPFAAMPARTRDGLKVSSSVGTARVHAAIIDLGRFLGIGTRKIAVGGQGLCLAVRKRGGATLAVPSLAEPHGTAGYKRA
jgi:hypothetical protein